MQLTTKMIILGVLIFFVIVTAVVVFGFYLNHPKGKNAVQKNDCKEDRDVK